MIGTCFYLFVLLTANVICYVNVYTLTSKDIFHFHALCFILLYCDKKNNNQTIMNNVSKYIFNTIFICIYFFYFVNCHTGDCINSSPAGKRRIAAEKQLSQLADEANLYGGDAALLEGSIDTFSSSSNSNQNTSNTPLASVTAVAIAICSVIAIVFVTIFTVLQVNIT